MPCRRLFLSICVSLGCLISTRPSEARDCNANGRDDVADISQGQSTDCNANDIPDECEESLLRFAAESGPTLSSGADVAVAVDWDRDASMPTSRASSTRWMSVWPVSMMIGTLELALSLPLRTMRTRSSPLSGSMWRSVMTRSMGISCSTLSASVAAPASMMGPTLRVFSKARSNLRISLLSSTRSTVSDVRS